jgi:hypothetical protein
MEIAAHHTLFCLFTAQTAHKRRETIGRMLTILTFTPTSTEVRSYRLYQQQFIMLIRRITRAQRMHHAATKLFSTHTLHNSYRT